MPSPIAPGFEFVEITRDVAPSGGVAVARVPPFLEGKTELLRSLALQLSFPSYFGENWDALYDALLRLLPNQGRAIIIIHEDLPNDLSEEDLKEYLEVLRDVIVERRAAGEPALQAVFPTHTKTFVERVLGDRSAT